jgi:nitrate/TMAO reductase-like tetraheme cytochrome c subunit
MPVKKVRTSLAILSIALLVVAIGLGGFSLYWDSTSPQSSCAACHEIQSSSNMWAQSGHRELPCKDCHGTASSNGLHSLKEKGMMFVHHFTRSGTEPVSLNETQVLEILDNCRRCHSREYAKWTSGGHSATYASIFLNEKHNATEQLNADCLRCHGMFYDGSIQDLVAPISVKGPWKLNMPEKSSQPAIPCLACHKVHRKGSPAVRAEYSDPKKIFYDRKVDRSKALFFDRYEKSHIEVADLPLPGLWVGEEKVEVSDDARQKICLQCHAPNAFHQAGTADDRTPRGVHEGIGCLACHDNHSNQSRQSCMNCHPAISNCQLDVTKMNTTFADGKSPHNIHFVRCIDCHTKGIPTKHVPRL